MKLLTWCCAVLLGAVPCWGQPGSVDPTFFPRAETDDYVQAMAVQNDGAVVVGGLFRTVNGFPRKALARLRADGSLDHGFASIITNGLVSSILLHSGSNILVGGFFNGMNFARLLPNGNLDTNWFISVDGGVSCLATQRDGKILLGGSFTSVHGQPRSRLARLNANGSLDNSFAPTIGGTVFSVAVQRDGKILIGGTFQSVNEQPRRNLARLNADGGSDNSFLHNLTGPDEDVRCLALQPDDKILVGGWFTRINDATRGYLARLNPSDGSLDEQFLSADFFSGPNYQVSSILVQSSDEVVICGGFTSYSGTSCAGLARLNQGFLNTTYPHTLEAGSSVWSIALQPDGSLLAAGVSPQSYYRIARIKSGGILDRSGFSGRVGIGVGLQYSASVLAMALQPDGKVLVGGSWNEVDTEPRHHLVRFNPDGSLDRTFVDPEISGGAVYSIIVQPDRKILVSGSFAFVGNARRAGLVRLLENGTRDASFAGDQSNNRHFVESMVLESDGGVWAGGYSNVGGGVVNYLVRFLSDGRPDPAFNSNLGSIAFGVKKLFAVSNEIFAVWSWDTNSVDNYDRIARLRPNGQVDQVLPILFKGYLSDVIVQRDGRWLMRGDFRVDSDPVQRRLVRLDSNGSVDGSFLNNLSGPDNFVFGMALQADGKIVIGGEFFLVNGEARSGMARLHPDGRVDLNFYPGFTGVGDGTVTRVLIQPDGKALIGGSFSDNRGVFRYFARLLGDAPPAMVRPLLNQTNYAGTNVLFVNAVGTSETFYQWYANGAPIPGATSSNLAGFDFRYDTTVQVIATNWFGGAVTSSANYKVVYLSGQEMKPPLTASAGNLPPAGPLVAPPNSAVWDGQALFAVDPGEISVIWRDAANNELRVTARIQGRLDPGERWRAQLSVADPRLASGAHHDDFQLSTLTPGQEYALYLQNGPTLPSLLRLLDSNNGSLISSISVVNDEALLNFRAASGRTYRAQVTTVSSNQTGPYLVGFYPVLRECGQVLGSLAETDLRDGVRSNQTYYADDYLLQSTRPTVQLRVAATGFPPRIWVWSIAGEVGAGDAFRGDGLQANGVISNAHSRLWGVRISSEMAGATGDYTLASDGGGTVMGFFPGAGVMGQEVRISTSQLDVENTLTGVSFGGTLDTNARYDATLGQVVAQVPAGARSGRIEVLTDNCSALSTAEFYVLAPLSGTTAGQNRQSISFGVSNAASGINVIETATNLSLPIWWRPLWTNVVPAGVWRYTNRVEPAVPQEFFRARIP